jgi:hypothetical protein
MKKKQLVPIEFRAKPRPEVEAELRRLKIYTRTMKNIREVPYSHGSNQELAVKEANEATSAGEFLKWAFLWRNTPEGGDYWCDIVYISGLLKGTKLIPRRLRIYKA